MMYLCRLQSPLGEITMASEGGFLCGLWIAGQRHFAAGLPDSFTTLPPPESAEAKTKFVTSTDEKTTPSTVSSPGSPAQASEVFALVSAWLDSYFRGLRPDLSRVLPLLRGRGTDFQRRVWAELTKIPYGETVTYGDIARAVGSSPRAVGGAVGRNPISIIVPCHRVVGSGGSLTGYASGLDLKQRLLTLESTSKQPSSSRIFLLSNQRNF